MTARVVGEWRSATFPPCLELLTISEGPANDFVGIVKSGGHLGEKGFYICLQISCSSQTKIRLVGWSECKHIFNGIVVQSQVLVSGGRFIQSRQEPGIFEWVAVEKDKSLVLAWPQQPQALSASPTAIDLFAGIGGSHIACDCIGLPVAYAVDVDARLC